MTYLKTRSTKLKAVAGGIAMLVVVGFVFASVHAFAFTKAAADDDSLSSTTPDVTVVSDASSTTPVDPTDPADDASSTDASSTPSDTSTTTPDVTADAPVVSPDADSLPTGQTCHFISNVSTDSSTSDTDDAATSTLVSPINPAWTATTTNPNAQWIWGDVLTDAEAQTGTTNTFTQNFWVTGSATGKLQIAADNTYTVTVNGHTVDTSNQDAGGHNFGAALTYDVSADLNPGQINTLTITVTNIAVPGSTALSNPAGLLFDLKVNGDTCSGVAKVFIRKFLQTGSGDDTSISQVSSSSTFPDFPMTATWTAPNLNGGQQTTGTYPLGEYFGGAVHKFAAHTAYMAAPYSYTSTEITGGDSPVVASQDECSPGEFYLVGYKTGTDVANAESQPTTQDPEFTDTNGHHVEIVINAKCPPTPKECTVVSDTGTLVNTGHGTGHQPAVLVDPVNVAWTTILDGASWIWGENPTADPVNGATETFTKTFHLSAAPTADATLTLAADNTYSVLINGVQVGSSSAEDNYSSSTDIDVPAADLVQGDNKMVVTVTNLPMAGGTWQTNPGGLLYTLTMGGANCKSGNGGDKGTLTIVKNTTGGDGTFDFDINPQDDEEDVAQTQPSVVTVTTVNGTGATSTKLTPGDYNVTEDVPEGWTLTGHGCVYSGGDEVGDPIDNGEDITVDAGDSVTCTFTNTDNGEGGGGPTNTYSTSTVQAANLSSDGSGTGQNGWFFYNDTSNVIDNTIGSFVLGPLTPPLGTGSAEMTLGVSPNDRKDLVTAQYSGTPLSDITALSYASYSHSGSGIAADESPYLLFDVDFTGTSTAYQNRLVYVPRNNGSVPQDTWNHNDAIQGGAAKWVYSGANWPATNVGPDAGGPTQPGMTTMRTWNQILADYPSARLLTPGLLGVRVGEPGPATYTGDVDDFAIGVENTAQTNIQTDTYDFEPTSVTPDNGNNGSSGGNGGGGSGQFTGGGSGLHPAVLGASTTTVPQGEVLGATCNPILTSYLREGRKNPVDQVEILQNFLNGNLGITLPITGFFGSATFKAVSAFQTKYGSSVLAPWVPFGLHSATDPTGYVYKTTKYEINYLACPTNGALTPSLP